MPKSVGPYFPDRPPTQAGLRTYSRIQPHLPHLSHWCSLKLSAQQDELKQNSFKTGLKRFCFGLISLFGQFKIHKIINSELE